MTEKIKYIINLKNVVGKQDDEEEEEKQEEREDEKNKDDEHLKILY